MKKIFILLTLLVAGCGPMTAHAGQKRPFDSTNQSSCAKRTRFSQREQRRQEELNKLLFKAIREENVQDAERLIQLGADKEARNSFHNTPMIEAVKKQNSHLITMLHRLEASLESADEMEGMTPLHHAADEVNPEIARYLLRLGANQDSRDDGLATPFQRAAMHGNLQTLVALTDHRNPHQQIYQTDQDEWTALHHAADGGHTDVVEYLANTLASNTRKHNNEGNTPLHLAVQATSVKHKFQVKTVNDYARTIVALLRNEQIFNLSRNNNSTVNQVNFDGFTPLHYAAQYPQLALFLLNHGADRKAKTPLGDTLDSLASPELRRELRNTPVQPTNEWTPLMRVAHATTQLDENSKQALKIAIAQEQYPTYITSTFDSALSVAGSEPVRQFIREQIHADIRDTITPHSHSADVSELILGFTGGYKASREE